MAEIERVIPMMEATEDPKVLKMDIEPKKMLVVGVEFNLESKETILVVQKVPKGKRRYISHR